MKYPFKINSIEEYKDSYQRSLDNPEKFWAEIANNFTWRKKWDKVLDYSFTDYYAKWFINGKLNITENCLDRHLQEHGNDIAFIWEPNEKSSDSVSLTYNDLHKRVIQFSAMLKKNGVKKGDRVCIYMGMVLELPIAMLACARIGAIHSVVFGGFSAQSISDRIVDAQIEYVITCDGAFRGNKQFDLKKIVDDAINTLSDKKLIKKVFVQKRTGTDVKMVEGRDVWITEELNKPEIKSLTDFPAEEMDSEDPLFILYTSGSTGKPKGVVHTIGGYMIFVNYTFVNAFQYKKGEVFFCTADIGWITGHSYILYAPLLAGGTSLMFEGAPNYPSSSRFWDIIDRHKVNIFYTAPTALRTLMGAGDEYYQNHDLSSIRVLGTVGEPINEEAWEWYHKHIGKGKCDIIDTWWQTETGGMMITNMAGVTPQKPTFATLPMPGIHPILVDEKGKEIIGNDVSGILCIKAPWPSMLRTTWGDHERCKSNYFSTFKGLYYCGDGAHRDENGMYRITGRIDDVINVSGHRIGTAEIENIIDEHDSVTESAVVGYPHDLKGQGIYAYVIYHGEESDKIRKEISDLVAEKIGAFSRPEKIQFVAALPRTRSGKIVRRLLRKIAENDMDNLGDITTLLNPEVIADIKKNKL